ncbi:virion structural protein [Dinoroseobacter phage vB_DshP-R7L]|uniref:Sialate O-acetylesterase domain-containing protein n=1 Tax=Dinoroseobacter phage vB_DshP-R7L TaxID=2873349 RepID=A0AAE8XEG2_9CAUD|nr:virion structural protein [Dinoroseobacter phage vB_DshP-R7L]UAT28879.1 hypothetical protein R7L_gp40 [Dinoroseobacter phage vB_DshP-R7L]
MWPIISGTIASSFPAAGTPPVSAFNTPHRYWRLKFQDGDSASYCSLAEVQFRAVASGPSIATGGTAFGSTDRGGSWVKSNAFDGDNNTFFSSTVSYPEVYLGYDFGTDVTVNEVMIRARPTFQEHTPTLWVLEASHDNILFAVQSMGAVTVDWTAAQEVVWNLENNTFDSLHQRVGFIFSDATHEFVGNQFYSRVPISLDGATLRASIAGKNWQGVVAKVTSTGRVISHEHTFTLSPGNGTNDTVTFTPPIVLKPNENFLIGVRDTVDAATRLNNITAGDSFGFVEKVGDGQKFIADELPPVGSVNDATEANGFFIHPKGTFTREDNSVPDMTGKTLVIMIAGQSNAIGRGTDLLSIDTTPVTNIKMINSLSSIVDATEPVSHNGNENGSQGGYGFAVAREAMTRYSPDQVVLVGCGEGSTGFVDGNWSASRGATYDEMKARWNAAIAEIKSTYGTDVEIMVIWTQGEDECQNYDTLFDDADDVGRHRTMVQHLFHTMREEWDDLSHDTIFITTPFPATATLQAFSSYTNVQNDIAAVRDTMGRCEHADISGVTQTFQDTVHWDMATCRQMPTPILDAYEAAHWNHRFPDTTAMISIPDPSRVSVPISLDARGLADDAVLYNHGIYKEFDNKRVKIKNGAMSFDGDAELRWRDNGKPIIGANDFVLKIGFSAVSISTLQALFSDYNTSGNKRSWLLRLSSSALQFYGSTSGTSATLLLTKTGLLSNTHYDVEIRRVGTAMELFVNGVSEDTYTGAFTFYDTGLTESVFLGEYNNNYELEGDITYASLEFI